MHWPWIVLISRWMFSPLNTEISRFYLSAERFKVKQPGPAVQSAAHLIAESGPRVRKRFWARLSFGWFKKGCWQWISKYGHLVLHRCVGGLSLHRNRVSRLTDWFDITIIGYLGGNTTTKVIVWLWFKNTNYPVLKPSFPLPSCFVLEKIFNVSGHSAK